MKTRTLKLTDAEMNHILCLLKRNREDGSYNAPKDQYWARAGRIELKFGKQEHAPEGANEKVKP
jgi:hypothetical protein